MNTESLFDVGGMHCGSCVRRITKVLDALEGVGEVSASAPDKTVRVRHDPALVSAEQLAGALAALTFVLKIRGASPAPPKRAGRPDTVARKAPRVARVGGPDAPPPGFVQRARSRFRVG